VNSDAKVIASNLVTAYDKHILTFDQIDKTDGTGTINHPRQLVAIASEHVADIKKAWDEVSFHLLQNITKTMQVLSAVYAEPTVDKYDTTYCAPLDFELASPDALVDLTRLARELSNHYGVGPVTDAAVDTIQAIDQAVIINVAHTGEPWFANNPKPVWEFDDAAGIAIYADLVGMDLDGNDTRTLLWQSHWYTDTKFAGVASNAHPYGFVQGGYDGVIWQPTGTGVTWADLLQHWWKESLTEAQAPLATAACIPEFPPVSQARISLPLIFVPEQAN